MKLSESNSGETYIPLVYTSHKNSKKKIGLVIKEWCQYKLSMATAHKEWPHIDWPHKDCTHQDLPHRRNAKTPVFVGSDNIQVKSLVWGHINQPGMLEYTTYTTLNETF